MAPAPPGARAPADGSVAGCTHELARSVRPTTEGSSTGEEGIGARGATGPRKTVPEAVRAGTGAVLPVNLARAAPSWMALVNRAAGFFSRHRRITASSSGGISGRIARGASGAPVRSVE